MKALDTVVKEELEKIESGYYVTVQRLSNVAYFQAEQLKYLKDLIEKNWATYSILVRAKPDMSEEERTKRVYKIIKREIKRIETNYSNYSDTVISNGLTPSMGLGWTNNEVYPMDAQTIERVTPLGWRVVNGYRKAGGLKPVNRKAPKEPEIKMKG